tara:strand:- start:51 stop:260 length:210 start_codon:yes stop_codon:yes gene_type:complete
MRTYYCSDCGKGTDVVSGKITKCKCGKVFGIAGKVSDYINMRNTLSGTTKIEFSESTVADSVKKMGGSI